jgi:hypothetical protein
MSAAMNERLVEIAQQARQAPHGAKEPVYQAACDELGLTRATLLRKIKKAAFSAPRKRRADAGSTALTHQDAQTIAAYIKAHTRANGKQLMVLEHAIEILRANKAIDIDQIDEETGLFTTLSISTIRRALKTYGLDFDTLNAPAPSIQLSSKHPNYLWEMDWSICVLYYLPKDGLRIMDEREFEKNKPANFKKAELDRVWRGVVVDHCSGSIYVEYMFGGESAANTAQLFLNAMQQRENQPFYGAPHHLYTDAGSGNTSAVFKNLCRSLSVDFKWHMPGNAKATGSVEKGQDIIEREFESCLKSIRITSIEQLNAQAKRWMLAFNSSRIHSRHKMTRFGAWLKIKPEQLRIAPPVELCKELARTAPIERTVSEHLTIDYKGNTYTVAHIDDVHVNKKVLVCINPYRPNTVQIVQTNEDGRDVFYVAEAATQNNEFGFYDSAVIYGEGYKSHAKTSAQKQSEQLDQLITGTSNAADMAQAVKEKRLPFNGTIDPFKPIADFTAPSFMPRRGTALNVPDLAVPEIKPLTLIEAKMRLRNLLGRAVTSEENAMLKQNYPNGMMEEQLIEIRNVLEGKTKGPRLVAVG